MSKFYRKIESDKIVKKILDISRNVNKLVLDSDPTADDADYWAICEYSSGELKSYIDFEHHLNDIHTPLNATYAEIGRVYPDFLKFIEDFGLHPYFGKAVSGNFGVHKHAFSDDSRWNICVMDSNTENSVVGFHYPVVGKELYGECQGQYNYDHLANDREVTTELTIYTKPEEIYSFNVWEWHSFYVPEHKKTDTYLYYFKNAVTEEDIDNILKRIEKL